MSKEETLEDRHHATWAGFWGPPLIAPSLQRTGEQGLHLANPGDPISSGLRGPGNVYLTVAIIMPDVL